jgi:hypothetical protein
MIDFPQRLQLTWISSASIFTRGRKNLAGGPHSTFLSVLSVHHSAMRQTARPAAAGRFMNLAPLPAKGWLKASSQ